MTFRRTKVEWTFRASDSKEITKTLDQEPEDSDRESTRASTAVACSRRDSYSEAPPLPESSPIVEKHVLRRRPRLSPEWQPPRRTVEDLDLNEDEIAAAVGSMFCRIPEKQLSAWTEHCIKFCHRGGTWGKWLTVARCLDMSVAEPPN